MAVHTAKLWPQLIYILFLYYKRCSEPSSEIERKETAIFILSKCCTKLFTSLHSINLGMYLLCD